MNSLIDGTITDFDEGDLVNGTVVKIEHDEVLARHRIQDRGRHSPPASSPSARTSTPRDRRRRRRGRGPGPPEGGQGRPSDPVQEACSVRARLEPASRRSSRTRSSSRASSSRSSRAASSSTSVCAASCPRRWSRFAACGTSALRGHRHRGQDHRDGQQPQQRRPVPRVRGSRRPARPRSLRDPHPARRAARSARASCPRSSTSVPSWTSAASTAWSTSPSCPGSTSTTPPRSSRSATRSPSRFSTSTWTASASRSAQGDHGGPVAALVETYPVGAIVEGKVTKLVPFGAFVDARGGHRGPGAHLRDGRAARREPRAGRPGRRRRPGQDHRHRPRASSHLAVHEVRCRDPRRRDRGHPRFLPRRRTTRLRPRLRRRVACISAIVAIMRKKSLGFAPGDLFCALKDASQ